MGMWLGPGLERGCLLVWQLANRLIHSTYSYIFFGLLYWYCDHHKIAPMPIRWSEMVSIESTRAKPQQAHNKHDQVQAVYIFPGSVLYLFIMLFHHILSWLSGILTKGLENNSITIYITHHVSLTAVLNKNLPYIAFGQLTNHTKI